MKSSHNFLEEIINTLSSWDIFSGHWMPTCNFFWILTFFTIFDPLPHQNSIKICIMNLQAMQKKLYNFIFENDKSGFLNKSLKIIKDIKRITQNNNFISNLFLYQCYFELFFQYLLLSLDCYLKSLMMNFIVYSKHVA